MKVFATALLFFQVATGLASSPDAATTAELDPSEVESSPETASKVEDLDLMEDMIEQGYGSMESMSYNYYVGGHTEYGQTGVIDISPKEQCAIYQRSQNIYSSRLGAAFKSGDAFFSLREGGYPTEYCGASCGLMRTCPDTCPTKEDIANFCEPLEDVASFDPNCPFCPDTCRISCISWVSFCCSCAPARELVLLDVNRLGGTAFASDTKWGFEREFSASYYRVDVSWIHNGATPDAVRAIVDSKKGKGGAGLQFTSDISKYYYTQASFIAKYSTDDFNWVHNEDPNLSEDGIVFKGVETDKGQVYPKMDAEFRLIFQDSTGHHISAEPYKLNQKLKIQAADPNLKYNRFEFSIDFDNTLAATIFGPSQPSFKCIRTVGFMITAAAKRYFNDRELFEEDADVLSTQEEEVAETQGLLNPHGYYTAYVQQFYIEVKQPTFVSVSPVTVLSAE